MKKKPWVEGCAAHTHREGSSSSTSASREGWSGVSPGQRWQSAQASNTTQHNTIESLCEFSGGLNHPDKRSVLMDQISEKAQHFRISQHLKSDN